MGTYEPSDHGDSSVRFYPYGAHGLLIAVPVSLLFWGIIALLLFR